MKKIFNFYCLHAVPFLGGAERSMFSYFKKLVNEFDITVYCFLDENGKKFNSQTISIQDDIRIIQTPAMIENCFLNSLRTNRPDIVGTQLLFSDPIVFLAHKNNIPVYYFAHGLFEDICQHHLTNGCVHNDLATCEFLKFCPNETNLKRFKEKYSLCSKIFCNSQYTKSIFKRFFPEIINKLEVMHPYIDVDNFKYLKKSHRKINERKRILAINSNFTKGRNQIINLANKRPDWDFIYVGVKDCDRQELSKIKNIQLHPNSDNMSSFYHSCDVLLVPTFMHETFSMVTCESVLCGTPVVCSNKGNLPNLIKDGHSGFVMETFDTWDWEDAIQKCFNLEITEEVSDSYRRIYNPKRGIEVFMNGITGGVIVEKPKEIDFNEKFKAMFGVEW